MLDMIDSALDLLGPDIELLVEMLHDLGEKHARYGVTPEMFTVMGESLSEMMGSTLGESVYNKAAEAAWAETYEAISGDMVRALKIFKK